MTNPCDSLSAAFEDLRREYRCTPAADGRSLIVTTGRYFGDGDAVEVFVRFSDDGDRVAVSDGGLARARRGIVTNNEMSRGAQTLWDDILAEFGVLEIEDRVYVRGRAGQAAQLIAQVADASLTLDSVKLLIDQERATFAARLENWLRLDAQVQLAEDRTIFSRLGEPQTVTAIVESQRGRIAIQGAGGRTGGGILNAAYRAHWVFSGVDESELPIDHRLVVLERTEGRRTKNGTLAMVPRLAEVAYVGTFEAQISLLRFLREPPPPNRDMVNVPFGQQSIEA